MNGKRKFCLAAFFAISGTAMVFVGKLDGGAWVGLVGTVLGLYGVANIVDKKLGGQG